MAKANEVLYSGDGQMAAVPAAEPIITRERIRVMLQSDQKIHVVGRGKESARLANA